MSTHEPIPPCTTVDPEWWFSGVDAERQAAIALCGVCPVAQQCLELALAGERHTPAAYRYGIYAGTTPNQRWQIVTGQLAWPEWPSDPLTEPVHTPRHREQGATR